MKKTAIFVIAACVLAGCNSVPQPKMPDESNRQPVNKTAPAQVKGALR